MKVSSKSDSEVEINPYWLNVKMDELHELGKPTEVLFPEDNSIPDLVSTSESEDSVIIILTPPNSTCSTMDSEGGVASLDDEEMNELEMDEGEEG